MLLYLSVILLVNSAYISAFSEQHIANKIIQFDAICTDDVPKLTQTVYGFLDFTTTIGNTVMVFSPQSSPQFEPMVNKTTTPTNIIETRPPDHENKTSKNGIKPTPLIATSSKEQSETTSESVKKEPITLLSTPVKTLEFPEYALLSRQPEEYVEETFRLVNLKSRADPDRQRVFQSSRDKFSHSTGLLPKKKENLTKNGFSVIKETGAISTKASSKLHQSVTNTEKRSKPRQSSTSRVLKTLTANIQASRTPLESASQQSGFTKSHRKTNREPSEKRKSSRNKGKRRHKTSQNSVLHITPSTLESSSRRSYRTKTNNNNSNNQQVQLQLDENLANISQNNLKLNRRPGRWQYKSLPKPKVNIRKASANTTRIATTTADTLMINDTILESNDKNQIQKAISLGRDLDAVGSQNTVVSDNEQIKPLNFVQTLNVEISTPSNFDDTYYEIATIKSPFIFQAGVVKKTRFLTVTSTIEKTIKNDHIDEYSEDDGPLTENILESSSQMKESTLDGSITTLKAIYITDSLETPELETITDSFTITQTKLRTQILPVIFEKKNETIQLTLVQTYDYTSMVTVTQTVSPFRDNFIPTKNFKDFEGILDEAGSEINLDLDFGDEGNFGHSDVKLNANNKKELKGAFNSTNGDAQLIQFNNSEQISKPEIPILSQGNNVITTTRPIIKLETVWESYVVPLIRGTDSLLRTLSKSVGVVEKTEYATEVSTILMPMPMPMSQYPNPFSPNPYSINPYYNPLLGIPQQQFVTSSQIFSTLITQTSSKVLKLTFGAKTAYTTIFSSSVVPTAVTQLITATVPAQNSGSFPNPYYPPPFNPYAYVG